MKVVLLASGRSLRMWPVADKNFLAFLGKPLLNHQINALQSVGCKDILVIAGQHNIKRIKRLGISVREQKNLDLGMAGGVLTAASWVGNDPFLLVSASDVVDPEAYALIADHIKQKKSFMLAKKLNSYFPGGYLNTRKNKRIERIVEKPKEGKMPSNLVNIIFHYHTQSKQLFEELRRTTSDGDNLYEKSVQKLLEKNIEYYAILYKGFWQALKYPWHVLGLKDYYLHQLKSTLSKGKNVEISKSAKIYGAVRLEDGVKVFDNAVIQGPAYIGAHTVIATNALVRNSHIGAGCVIGFGTEVARSYLGDDVWTHTNYIGDSVIGNDVSFGAGTVTGNLRFDEESVKVLVHKKWRGALEENRVDTGMNKLGLITGDHLRIGINTSFMPGVRIGSNCCVGPGITIAQDIPDNSFVTGKSELKIVKNLITSSPRHLIT